jgi:hypothetical protein
MFWAPQTVSARVSYLLCKVIPGQQFINPVDLVICDTAENISEPSLWINAVELGSFNQGEGDCHGFAATNNPRQFSGVYSIIV